MSWDRVLGELLSLREKEGDYIRSTLARSKETFWQEPLRNLCEEARARSHTHKPTDAHFGTGLTVECQRNYSWALQKCIWRGSDSVIACMENTFIKEDMHAHTYTHAHKCVRTHPNLDFITALVRQEFEGNTTPLALIKENQSLWSNSQEVSAALTLQPHPRQTMSNNLTHLN